MNAHGSSLTDHDRRMVRLYVWPGFATRSQAAAFLERDREDGTVQGELAVVLALLDEEWAAKQEAERGWPAVTDVDRLNEAFDALRAVGFICLHDAGVTMSEGDTEVSEVWHRAGGDASGLVGYCFYHRQDLEHVLDRGELYLAFGGLSSDPDERLAAGRAVAEAMARVGLPVRWDGTAARRIVLAPFRWQYRSPTDVGPG